MDLVGGERVAVRVSDQASSYPRPGQTVMTTVSPPGVAGSQTNLVRMPAPLADGASTSTPAASS